MGGFSPQPFGTGPISPISSLLVAPVTGYSSLLEPRTEENWLPAPPPEAVFTGPKPLQPLKLARIRDRLPMSQGRRGASGVFQAGFRFGGFFNLHVAKLFGVKDFATIQALDEFRVFVPGNDAYPGVSAGGCHRSWILWEKYPSRKIVPAFSPI